MTATRLQAKNEMYAIFTTAWEADETSATVPVQYPDVAWPGPPKEGAWARIAIAHEAGFPATLGGETGNRRFRKLGTVTVQIFTEFGKGEQEADELAIIAEKAFEGEVTSPGRVIFRNARTIEIGRDGQWFQTNVLVDFEYDEVR